MYSGRRVSIHTSVAGTGPGIIFGKTPSMKRALIVIAGFLIPAVVFSQQEIKLEDINKHIGDSVRVCTKIYGGIYLDRSKGQPTLLNAGGSYPANPLTVVIWPDTRKQFKESPEIFFKDKQVCIIGKVELYKDKPQIVVHTESQLTIQP